MDAVGSVDGVARSAGSVLVGQAAPHAPSASFSSSSTSMKRSRATRGAPAAASSATSASTSRKRGGSATAAPAAKKGPVRTPVAGDEDSGESDEGPVYKKDKYFGGGWWYPDGTFVSTKAAKAALKAGARASTNEWDAAKVKTGAVIAARTGTTRARASKAGAKAGTAAQASRGSTARRGARAAGKASSKVSGNETTSNARCSGTCRLARPCPTAKNKTGRGACGNAGCANHGAIYGCKSCGIRLCSFECINAHLFEGRAIKAGLSRLKADEFHPWYQGESA